MVACEIEGGAFVELDGGIERESDVVGEGNSCMGANMGLKDVESRWSEEKDDACGHENSSKMGGRVRVLGRVGDTGGIGNGKLYRSLSSSLVG